MYDVENIPTPYEIARRTRSNIEHKLDMLTADYNIHARAAEELFAKMEVCLEKLQEFDAWLELHKGEAHE